jgi:hypothetical protein
MKSAKSFETTLEIYSTTGEFLGSCGGCSYAIADGWNPFEVIDCLLTEVLPETALEINAGREEIGEIRIKICTDNALAPSPRFETWHEEAAYWYGEAEPVE